MTKITKTMTIQEIIEKNPHAIKLLINSGMHCVGCHMMAVETLEEGCKSHDMSDKDIDKLVEEINSKN